MAAKSEVATRWGEFGLGTVGRDLQVGRRLFHASLHVTCFPEGITIRVT